MTLNTKTAGSASLSFDFVQDLRDLKDTVLSSRACCRGDLDVVTTLEATCKEEFSGAHVLQPITSKLKGYLESLDVLEGRVQNTIDLVRLATYGIEYKMRWLTQLYVQIGYALDYHNQEQASEINDRLLYLAENSFDTSRSVAIITFVSAVYLPASFVSVSFLDTRSNQYAAH